METWQFHAFKRIFVGLTMIGLFLVSAAFSVNGFGFVVPGWGWAAIILTTSITAGEFMMTTGANKKSIKLLMYGLASYAYDIGTTFIGLLLAQNMPSLEEKPVLYAMDACIAVLLAIVPEVGFEWAITEDVKSPKQLPQPRGVEKTDSGYPAFDDIARRWQHRHGKKGRN